MRKIKLWVDDEIAAPRGYMGVGTVIQAKKVIQYYENKYPQDHQYHVELIDIDHDAGDCAQYGGDYIKLLEWLEETGRNYPIHIHSTDHTAVENMRRIIQRNNWKEV